MAVVTFDTLQFVETLKEAGIPEAQAKAFSTAVKNSHETAELATKADLREYESAIRNDLEKLEIGLRHDISDLRKDVEAKFIAIEGKFVALNTEMSVMKWLLGVIAGSILGIFIKSFF